MPDTEINQLVIGQQELWEAVKSLIEARYPALAVVKMPVPEDHIQNWMIVPRIP